MPGQRSGVIGPLVSVSRRSEASRFISALPTVNLSVGVPASAGPDRLKAVLQPPDRTLTKH
jgi:hypothetical protein